MAILPYGSIRFAEISSRIARSARHTVARSSSPSSSRLAMVRSATRATISPNSSRSSAARRQASSALIHCLRDIKVKERVVRQRSKADWVRFEKTSFFRRALAPEGGIARRKTPEALNRVAVANGIRERKVILAETFAGEPERDVLVLQRLRMCERKVVEAADRSRCFQIEPVLQRHASHIARHRIGRKRLGPAPEHVPGKLVEDNDEGERPFHAVLPGLAGAFTRRAPGLFEAAPDGGIETRVAGEPPLRRSLLEPEIQDFAGTCDAHAASSPPPARIATVISAESSSIKPAHFAGAAAIPSKLGMFYTLFL